MNLFIVKESIKNYFDLHGGACASVKVEITVDDALPPRVQRNLVIHEIIECYCPSWHHDKIEELADLLIEGLNELEVG